MGQSQLAKKAWWEKPGADPDLAASPELVDKGCDKKTKGTTACLKIPLSTLLLSFNVGRRGIYIKIIPYREGGGQGLIPYQPQS